MKNTYKIFALAVLIGVAVYLALVNTNKRETKKISQEAPVAVAPAVVQENSTQSVTSGPTTIRFRIRPTFSNEQPAIPQSTNNPIGK